jgi:electron transfer flavoprotein alpha subunit
LNIIINYYTLLHLTLLQQPKNWVKNDSNSKSLGGKISALVIGEDCNYISERTSKIQGVDQVFEHLIKTPHFIPEIYEEILLNLQKNENFTHILTNHTTFGKQILPKLAAKLDVQPIT